MHVGVGSRGKGKGCFSPRKCIVDNEEMGDGEWRCSCVVVVLTGDLEVVRRVTSLSRHPGHKRVGKVVLQLV